MTHLSQFETIATSKKTGIEYPIAGEIASGYDRVVDQFIENFKNDSEVGACMSATIDGNVVADLWGGYQDRNKTKPWERDTIVCMMSVNKAVGATCMFHAMDHGFFSIDDPIAKYWPEFGQNGKAHIPIQWVLDHRSGLAVVEPRLPKGSIYDHTAMCGGFAKMRPLWEPGQQAGYHILSQGFLLAEVLRRTTGKTIGQYFRDEIAQPLGIDYFIGVPDSELDRCAEYCMVLGGTILDEAAKDPDSWQGRAWYQLKDGEDFNSVEWRKAEISSANGHGNARAIARLFAALVNDGTLDGVEVLKPGTTQRMTREQHNLTEVVMQRPYHQASGLLRNSPPICFQGPNPNSFGHHGVGGSIGFGDPDNKIAFSYGMNQMHARKDNGPRAGLLIKAVYESFGIPCETPAY